MYYTMHGCTFKEMELIQHFEVFQIGKTKYTEKGREYFPLLYLAEDKVFFTIHKTVIQLVYICV